MFQAQCCKKSSFAKICKNLIHSIALYNNLKCSARIQVYIEGAFEIAGMTGLCRYRYLHILGTSESADDFFFQYWY